MEFNRKFLLDMFMTKGISSLCGLLCCIFFIFTGGHALFKYMQN